MQAKGWVLPLPGVLPEEPQSGTISFLPHSNPGYEDPSVYCSPLSEIPSHSALLVWYLNRQACMGEESGVTLLASQISVMSQPPDPFPSQPAKSPDSRGGGAVLKTISKSLQSSPAASETSE